MNCSSTQLPVHADPRVCAGRRNSDWRPGEKGLNSCAGGVRIAIGERQALYIEREGKFSVHCSSGALWVTAPGSVTDVILTAVEELELPTHEKLVIVAVGDSQICIPPGFGIERPARGASSRIVERARR